MSLEHQILWALGLDLLLGDPRWIPHPVRLMGRLALALESPLRRVVRSPRRAGAAAAFTVLAATAAVTAALVLGARRIHPLAGDLVSILLLYTTLAARDLAHHSMEVYRALRSGDLAASRRRAARMVGRDTDKLDEPEVIRAAVESVAESTVDGVTAPLFYAFLGGPVGAMLYKAVNTLDSTFGYRDERYAEFGWASARIDDLANYLPARVTAPLIGVSAALLGLRPLQSLRVLLRDGRKHPSPNSGLPEAAVAGALGVQLGGMNTYAGEPSEKPRLGDPIVSLQRRHILQVNALMLLTTGLATALLLAVRAGLESWNGGTP
ncbi:MAG: cobalamin biosynthesis protein CobD [Planctomycetes bacterium]|nr:cobalamin biosynthesis protein CobD [Planctomycetota bacterium]